MSIDVSLISAVGSRRELREAQKRRNVLEKALKQRAKLDAAERARLEAEEYENRIDLLLSMHKQCSSQWDWRSLAVCLSPPAPIRRGTSEFHVRQAALLNGAQPTLKESFLIEAIECDVREHQQALDRHGNAVSQSQRFTSLAQRIVGRDHKAYLEALVDFSPLAELTDLGSCAHFTVNDHNFVECTVDLIGTAAIPAEQKTLTATGKLSVKAMPKTKFQSVYEDYVCSCILRIGREVFALLPIEYLLVTARSEILDPSTGVTSLEPVFSVFIDRARFSAIRFDSVDPSDALTRFEHRGELRKAATGGRFRKITPFAASALATSAPSAPVGYVEALSRVKTLGERCKQALNALESKSQRPIP